MLEMTKNKMTKLEGMMNDQMTKRSNVATSSFVLRHFLLAKRV